MVGTAIEARLPRYLTVAVCAAAGFGLAAAAGGDGEPGFDPGDTASWVIPAADLYGVSAVGDGVWAVGYWGTVLRSADGGQTWTNSPTPTDETLFAVSFADETHGWAVGAAGTILRSSDGGASWSPLAASVYDEFEGERPLDTPLFDVAAVSPHEAWTVGDFGVLLHTRDGEDWEQVRLTEETFADGNITDRILNGVHFTDPNHGWIAGEFGATLRTTDGGETWVGERTLEGAVEDVYLIDIAAGADDDGDELGDAFASGVGGVVIWTSDGGATWTAADVPTTAGLFGAALRGTDGLVVGDRGVMLTSLDGGVSWFEPDRPSLFNWLRGAAFAGNGRGYVVGQNGVVLRTDDEGRSFSQVAGAEPPPSSAVSVPDPGKSTSSGRGDGHPRPGTPAQPEVP